MEGASAVSVVQTLQTQQWYIYFVPYPLVQSALLLGRLIHSAPRLVAPYVSPVLKALVAKLRSALLPPLLPLPLPKSSSKGVVCGLSALV